MKKYLSEILLIQIVATYLVVLGHSYPFTIDVPGWLTQTQRFIYSFHMPLFVWISGYLLIYTQQTERYDMPGFARKRFLKLLVPYFALSLIAILPKYVSQPFLNDTVTLDGYSLLRIFFAPRENVWGHFWFLPMIFIQGVAAFLLDKVFVRIGIRKLGWACVTILTFAIYVIFYKKNISQWFSINDLILYSWLFAAGCFCGCYRVIGRLSVRHSLLYATVVFTLSIALFASGVLSAVTAIKSGIIAVLMIFALAELCIYISGRVNVDRNNVYAQTFTIFLLSWPCQAVANVVTERLLQWPYYAIMPIQFCTGIIGPMILIYLIAKIEKKYNFHWISFILGK